MSLNLVVSKLLRLDEHPKIKMLYFASAVTVASVCIVCLLVQNIAWYPPPEETLEELYHSYEPTTTQGGQPTCGILAIVNLCSFLGKQTDIGTVYLLTGLGNDGITLQACLAALEQLKIPCEAIRFSSGYDIPDSLPCICVVQKRAGLHAVVALRDGDNILLVDGSKSFNVSVDYFNRVYAYWTLVPAGAE